MQLVLARSRQLVAGLGNCGLCPAMETAHGGAQAAPAPAGTAAVHNSARLSEAQMEQLFQAMPAHERKSCAEWCVGGSTAVQLGRARRFA
jgi:hypothetical protein